MVFAIAVRAVVRIMNWYHLAKQSRIVNLFTVRPFRRPMSIQRGGFRRFRPMVQWHCAVCCDVIMEARPNKNFFSRVEFVYFIFVFVKSDLLNHGHLKEDWKPTV